MATDQLRHTTADAICTLLRARVEAERLPMPSPSAADYKGAQRHDPPSPGLLALAQGRDQRGAVVAALDEAIELSAWALARAKSAQVIPFPVPHVATRREAA